MNNAYKKALNGIKTACPSGTSHPNDFARVVDIFKRLTEAGKFVSHPDVIGDYLKLNGFSEDQADKIQSVYEVFETATKDNAGWSQDFVNDVLSS